MSEVNLVALSKPNVGASGCWDANELIAYTARVSNPANQNNPDTAPKLLRYLIKHGHWSPFEMVHMTLEINDMPSPKTLYQGKHECKTRRIAKHLLRPMILL